MAMSPPASKPLVFSAQVGILGTYVTIDSNLPSSRFGCRLGLFFFAVCLRWIFVFLSFRFVSFRFVSFRFFFFFFFFFCFFFSFFFFIFIFFSFFFILFFRFFIDIHFLIIILSY